MGSAEFQTSLATTYKNIIYEAIQHGNYDFLLVVTGYSHFFNANDRLPCDKQYLFRGNYLTQVLRSQLNTLVVNLNVVIEDIIGGVNREHTNGMLAAKVVFFDMDYWYAGYRFCEPDKDWLTGSWFLTIYGNDILADGTVVANDKPYDTPMNLPSYAITCDPNDPDLGNRFMCDYALYLARGGAPIDNVSTAFYGPEIMKALHPKTAGH